MHTAFRFDRYYLRRQVISLTGKIRLYTPDGQLVLYCHQKMFRLKEDIRAYSDESCTPGTFIHPGAIGYRFFGCI